MHDNSRRQFLKETTAFAASSMLGTGCRSRAAELPVGARHQTRPDALTDLPLARMIELLQAKEISPTELIQAHIARIRAVNPRINAVVYLDETRARKAAATADTRLVRGTVDWDKEYLFGIPFSVKNTMDVKGVPTVCGAPAWKDNIAKDDAYYVKRYKDAGAIFLAATNMPFHSLGMESDNAVFGKTNNPHDLSRTAGGSSGGEGALIASGGSPMGIATDWGGSTRQPAHWNGLFALCPAARGLCWQGFPGTAAGKGPPFPRIGTMARSVKDLDKLKRIFVEPARRPRALAKPLEDSRTLNLADFKIAYFTRWASRENDAAADVIKAVSLAARALEQQGAKIQEHRPTFLEQTLDIANSLAMKDVSSTRLRKWAKEMGAESDAALNRFIGLVERLEGELPPKRQARMVAEYSRWVKNYDRLMSDFDAIILPVTDMPAPKHGTTTLRRISKGISSYNFVANLTDTSPSGTAPILKTSEGLPVGVGVVGRAFAEEKVLRILYALEDAFGGRIRPNI